MSYHDRKTFFLINDRVRQNAIEMIRVAAPESVVTVSPKARTSEQNAKLHAMLSDLARSDLMWAGKRRTMEEWKALIISAHAVATKHGGEVIPGIEGEFVAIRESSASMSVSRAASLIEYLTAFCVSHGVHLRDAQDGGFIHEPGSGEPSPPQPSEPVTSASGQEPQPLPDGVSNPAEQPVGAGAEGQEQSAPAPAPDEFNAEEWKWLRHSAYRLWIVTEKGEQERVDNAGKAIGDETGEEIGDAAFDKMKAIKKVCKQVCFGEMTPQDARRVIAQHLGISPEEVRGWEPT